LLLLIVHPLPWAKCLLVLISLGGSTYLPHSEAVLEKLKAADVIPFAISLNVLSIYSGALALQQLVMPLQAVPRFIWSIVLFACMLGLSLGGRDHIYEWLSNML
jgi:hypothetical protein